MSAWRNGWMLWPLETTDRVIDTACRCASPSLGLSICSVAGIRSAFEMIACASWLRVGVGRFSRPLRGVGALAMPDEGLDATRHVGSVCEVLPGAAVLPQLVPGVMVEIFIGRHCVAEGVEPTRWVISATRELSCEVEGEQFCLWSEEATERPPWEESLPPAWTETRLLTGETGEFPEGPRLSWFWWLARIRTFHMTGVVPGLGLLEGIVRYKCWTLRMQESFPTHAYATAGKVDTY